MVNFEKEIQYIKGVGPNRAMLLNKLGINTLKDLITYYPRGYEDRGKALKIAELIDGEDSLIEAIVVSKINENKVRKNMTIYKLIVRDDTGTCVMTWFNQSYLKNKFIMGKKYKFFGKVSKRYGTTEMNSPVFEEAEVSKNTGKIVPIYPTTYNLSQNMIRQIVENGLKIVNEDEAKLQETIPEYILKEYNLLDINNAINQIHFPKDFTSFENARKRLVFEELLTMQLALLQLKTRYAKQDGIQFDKNIKMSDVIDNLPFKLTKAQLNVLEEIDSDMESNKAMNRLLQGDVGSGKTIVSIIAAYKAVKCGYQVAIMAPTAILASQHLESFEGI